MASTKSQRGWWAIRPALERAVKKGSKKKSFHPGKTSKFKAIEISLRTWILRKRNKRIALTKKRVIAEAKEWDGHLSALTDDQLEDWGNSFCRHQAITARRIGCHAKGNSALLQWLVRRYRANLHQFFRRYALEGERARK